METAEDKIQLSREFKAPIEKVWAAITDPVSQKEWYFDFKGTWQLTLGHVFEWEGGDPSDKLWLHRGEILEIIHGQKLVHSWEYPGYSGYSTLTWELFPKGFTQTELNLSHHFEIPFDPTIPALQKEQFEKGWDYILNTSLKEYLEK